MKMHCNLSERGYDILLERGCLDHLSEVMNVERRTFIISDDGVPKELIMKIRTQLKDANLVIIKQGEASKNMENYELCLKMMIQKQYTRNDCVLAIGGGVVGDLAGFVAATYMRGVDFINIPTTTLSQIDSSIGGKVAIDMMGVKNCVGAFWQPRLVLIDPNVLTTLPLRHFYNGLVEALKAGLIQDKELFELFEKEDYLEHIDEIIERSLEVKRFVVEEDEKELGLRKILNFGHTVGHGIESALHFEKYYHGECVGLGMLAIIDDPEIKNRTKKILEKMNCPTHAEVKWEEVSKYIANDKKSKGEIITVVKVSQIGKSILKDIPIQDVVEIVKEVCE